MICMGEAGMKRVLFKIIVPVLILVLWVLMCYPVCQQENGFDYFLFWIMVGFPYGIRKMCMFLIPKNFGIAGSIGVVAFCHWWSDRWYHCNCKDDRCICGDNKDDCRHFWSR